MREMLLFGPRRRTDSPTYLKRLHAWQEFDGKHPEVWELFKANAIAIKNAGHARHSARTILEVARWHNDVNPNRDGGFKINDHFSPCCVRKLLAEEALHMNPDNPPGFVQQEFDERVFVQALNMSEI